MEIDVRGQVCPSTLLVALEHMNLRRSELRAGTLVLYIRTDNREATVTIPGTARNMGYEVEVEQRQGYYDIMIYHTRTENGVLA